VIAGVVVRRAGAGDIEGILRVERGASEAPQWGEARYREMLQGEGPLQRELLVAVEGERLAGFAVASVVLDEAELESVVVDAEFRRRGVGRLLCEAVLGWARERGATQIRLEVRAANHAAQGLYRGLGFQVNGLRRGYYRGPVDDAVLMAVSLT